MDTRMRVPLIVLSLAVLVPSGVAAENLMLIGKPPEWEISQVEPKNKFSHPLLVENLETPNQERRRLGLPIEASYPSRDPGVAEETPNQRRARMRLSRETSRPDDYAQKVY